MTSFRSEKTTIHFEMKIASSSGCVRFATIFLEITSSDCDGDGYSVASFCSEKTTIHFEMKIASSRGCDSFATTHMKIKMDFSKHDHLEETTTR